jgi:predicted permease
MAGALVPVMLITLGIQLAGMGRVRVSLDGVLAGSVRLVAGPILAIALAVPFGLTGIERGAGILQASMPAAVLTTLIAMEHDLLPDFVTTTVLFATLASSVTLTIVLAII